MSKWFDMLPLGAFEPRACGRMRLHGGKGGGSSAPPPDPRLVEAQIKSMGVQDSAISDIRDMAAKMAPIQQEQMQFALDSSKTAYDQSQADRTFALGKRDQLSGLQDGIVADAKNFNGDAQAEILAGKATADVNSSFSSARDQTGRDLARRGINPASGAALAVGNQMTIAQAAAGAGAANNARTSARLEGYSLTDRASNSLAGYPSMASNGTTTGASLAASGLGIANTGLSGLTAGATSSAGVAGAMGSNAANMYGTMGSYKTAQDQANQGDSTADLLGGLGGAAMGAAKLAPIFMSDPRLKENIVKVGKHDDTGLNLYEFNYKTNPSVRFRGVMADEVLLFKPEAVIKASDGYLAVDYGQLGIEMVEV